MYHCRICFYLTGYKGRMFDIIREMAPLEHFFHEFLESEKPEKALTEKADVILADLHDMEIKEVLHNLILEKKKDAQLILLAEKKQLADIGEELPEIKDIWIVPMSEEEVRFRFLRWQQTCKMSRDFWQTSQFLETSMKHSPNLIWYEDKNGIHKKVNDSFCATVNKTKKQVEGQRHVSIWGAEQDDSSCLEPENEAAEKSKTCESEETIMTGEGMRRLTTYKSPLYDVDGSVMGTAGVAIDVTKERDYEQEITHKNHTLETIFTNLDCGVMHHSLDGTKILSINRAALEILGYQSKEEMIEKGFHMVADSVLEEDKPKLRKRIGELKKTGDSVSVEYRVQHQDGEILHIMGNVKLLEEDGEMFYQRFLLDCTDQKLKEKEKEKLHAELVQALSVDYSFVYFFSLETGMGFPLRNDDQVSQGLDSIFGNEIPFEESMENYIENYVYEDDKELMRQYVTLENMKEEISEQKAFHVNYRRVWNGKMEYFQMKAARAGINKKHLGIVLGFRSVDGKIRREMEKKNLLEDALYQANRASKAKSVFLSNMSHDIRTPLNAIVGFTALALTNIDRREQVEDYLKKIMSSGNHLLSLINDVLDMSRIESGKIHLDEKPCSLPDILHSLLNIVQTDVSAKRLDFCIDTVDVLDEDIYCDKLRLNQVLLNLLGNSVKYTPAGGIISMKIIEKAGVLEGYANYEFCIRDTGIGMSEEFVHRIFEPFEREKCSTISGIQGTGLGMTITKNIVDMMNGTIEVKSEQGVGTEFKVSFVFRLYSGKKETQIIPELKNCRALVADDDLNTCDSVSHMLSQIGLRAEWTLSGKEAVLLTKQANMRGDNYSVYIIDWLLPDLNGVEVIRRIRKEIGNSVPIIVLTVYDWSDIEEEAKQAGVTAFCSKPLFLSELRSCLNSVIHGEGIEKKADIAEEKKIRKGRILLAEDIDLNQEIAATILENAGFVTEIAENGQVAVDKLKRSEPGYYQLILMDIQMPVMNGYDATRKIRKLENKELASIPIIAMTANAFEEDKQEAIKSGMNGHIAKPIDIDLLFETLDKILS